MNLYKSLQNFLFYLMMFETISAVIKAWITQKLKKVKKNSLRSLKVYSVFFLV